MDDSLPLYPPNKYIFRLWSTMPVNILFLTIFSPVVFGTFHELVFVLNAYIDTLSLVRGFPPYKNKVLLFAPPLTDAAPQWEGTILMLVKSCHNNSCVSNETDTSR